MKTWLDYYVLNHWKNYQDLGNLPGLPKLRTPLEAARLTHVSVLERPDLAIKNAKYESWGHSAIMQAEVLSPFLFNPGHTLSLQLTPELVQDFFGTKPPEDVNYEALLDKYGTIYIDIPPGLYRVMDGWSARAMVLHRAHFGRGRPHMFVPILREGKVDLDFQVESIFPFLHPIDDTVVVKTWDEGDPEGQPPEKDPAYYATKVKDLLEDLAKLALLYYESSESEKEALPFVSEEDIRRTSNPKKRRSRWMNASFFRVSQLKSPKGRFGRTNHDPLTIEGYNLQHRVPVRGHWRYQAHGPRWTLRRLQWIDAFERGPKDAPTKPTLHVLGDNRHE